MRIDTSFPEHSKYFLCLDVPYRYAGRHFEIAFCPYKEETNVSYPSLKERIAHFSLGLLLIIPLIGHVTAIANRILNPPLRVPSREENPAEATENIVNNRKKEKEAASPDTTSEPTNIPKPSKPKKTPTPPATPLPSPLTCPKAYLPGYKKAPQGFTQKILSSTYFDEKEKTCLFAAAASAYSDNLTGEEWVDAYDSLRYLNLLSVKNPELKFSPIPDHHTQFTDKPNKEFIELGPQQIEAVVEACKGFPIFGHIMQVNGNHRTAFVIDLENKTVEFYNSFGSDSTVKKPLQALAKKLSQKHGGTFKYIHKTEGIKLQPDVYQCGVWCCKLIEERVRVGKSFNPSALKKYDIVSYRNRLFDAVYKLRFYHMVGMKRLVEYLDKNEKNQGFLTSNGTFTYFWRKCLFQQPEIAEYRSNPLAQLGKTGEMPQHLLDLIEKSKKEHEDIFGEKII